MLSPCTGAARNSLPVQGRAFSRLLRRPGRSRRAGSTRRASCWAASRPPRDSRHADPGWMGTGSSFPQPAPRRAVSLPKALALSHLHNTGCSFLPAIEVTASRTETTEGEKRQQQREERSCLVQGQEQQGRPSASRDPTPSAAPLSPPTGILEAVQPPDTGLPLLQPSPGCSGIQGSRRGKTPMLVWLLGRGGAQIPRPGWGVSPLLSHSPGPWVGLANKSSAQGCPAAQHQVLIAVPGSVSSHPPCSGAPPQLIPIPTKFQPLGSEQPLATNKSPPRASCTAPASNRLCFT